MVDAALPGIVFDVDDTLYLEAEYVRSGFKAVARVVARTGAIGSAEAYDFLYGCFERGVRQNTFDLLFEKVPALQSRLEVRELVQAYRAHEPGIALLPGVGELLEELRIRGVGLGLITDGALESQERKVAALGLDKIVSQAVLTDHWGRNYWKPHPRAFEHIADAWKIPAERLVYIGDNPDKDFVAPNRLGWRTVRLRLPGQMRVDREPPTKEHAPGTTVSSVEDLTEALRE